MNLLALIALILEIIHWATTRDASLPFLALVALTLAVLLGAWTTVALPVRRP